MRDSQRRSMRNQGTIAMPLHPPKAVPRLPRSTGDEVACRVINAPTTTDQLWETLGKEHQMPSTVCGHGSEHELVTTERQPRNIGPHPDSSALNATLAQGCSPCRRRPHNHGPIVGEERVITAAAIIRPLQGASNIPRMARASGSGHDMC